MKIIKTGIFKNQWLCVCGNKSTTKGFYPSNAEGSYERDLWGRGKFYACVQCGRMIDPQTLEIVGLSRGFRLSASEVRDLLVSLQARGVRPLGVGYAIMVGRLTPSMYQALGRLTPQLALPFNSARSNSVFLGEEVKIDGT